MSSLRAAFTNSGFDSALPDDRLAWPNLGDMLGATHSRRSNLGRQIKLLGGLLGTLPHQGAFVELLERLPHWKPVFARNAKSFEPLVQSFMDRRFGAAQRFRQLAHDLDAATQAFGLGNCQRLAQGEPVKVWERPGCGAVQLSLNQVSRREGYWALSLYSEDGARLCQLTFSFPKPQYLMVGSVQGAAAQDERSMQGIRDLTRLAEGLRPPFLLIEVLRTLCLRWGVSMVGVDPRNHVKRKWHQQDLKVSFDYRAFWTELGGRQHADGFWAIPAQRATRDLQDVPSKRRAMYKRRQAMLEAMPSQIQNMPDGPLPAATVAAAWSARVSRRAVRASTSAQTDWSRRSALVLLAAFCLVGVYAWSVDYFTAKGERTVYTADCVGGDWVDGRCNGELVAGPRLRFRALRAQRQVLYWTVGATEPAQMLSNCDVTNGRNWTCPALVDVSSRTVLQMQHGQPFHRAWGVGEVHNVPKIRWLLMRAHLG